MGMFEHFARTPSSEQSCFLFLDAFFSFLSIEKKVLSLFHVSCFLFFFFALALLLFPTLKKGKHRKVLVVKVTIFLCGLSMFGPRWKGSWE